VVISRRHWIGCAVAASALGAASRLGHALESSTQPVAATATATATAVVIVDERFEVARALARSLALPAIPRVVLPRDVLALWHRQLAPLCQTGRHAIAGVTTERGFFLLRTLAADHRMRVLSSNALATRRADHEPLVSWTLGPRA
jgi:hypothetical protein